MQAYNIDGEKNSNIVPFYRLSLYVYVKNNFNLC